ncbi:MAG TPA: carboxyltransferase domain-containing protein [Myxococcales bacterium]
MPELRKLCEGAALLSLRNEDALDLAAALADDPPEGFLDAVPGARTLLLLYDPDVLDPARVDLSRRSRRPAARVVRLQACYDGADLDDVARELGVTREEVVRRHAEADHVVSFLGFAPGFAYMTGGFALPRLRTPRVRVPAGSLAVADGYTGIYPAATPGGWRLLGRVAARMFEPGANPPALLRPGDRVIFEPVGRLEEQPARTPVGSPSGPPLLRVLAPGAFTSVQGGPRYGLASSGVPAGGAMDVAALAAANHAAGNAPLAAALEITLAGPELEALQDVRVALGTEMQLLARGQRLRTGPVRRGVRAYLAVEGGLSQPLPGEPVRALGPGDTLHRASGPGPPGPRPPAAPLRWGEPLIEVRAHRGPQWDFFASPEDLFDREYRVSPSSDRRGLRLQGPALALARRSDIPPEGTAPGAVQVPGDGLPIVLGPDRPVTGGYAKIATVVPADFPLLAQARPGTAVRFVEQPWT